MKYSDGHVPIVAVLGAYGSYSSIASQKYFGQFSHAIQKTSLESVFQSVKVGESMYGVVPLENSSAGSVLETYDHLLENDLHLTGEAYLKIHHHLLGNHNVDLRNIRVCYSHPQAFIQCSTFFTKHPWIEKEAVSDTGTGAQRVSQSKNRNVAVIASSAARKRYRLTVLRKNVENAKENFTRFGIISRSLSQTGNKISLIFSLEHVPGSLVSTLSPFAKAGINLTKIESRPVYNRAWEYIFYLDFDLGAKSQLLTTILEDLRPCASSLTVLGQYMRGETYET